MSKDIPRKHHFVPQFFLKSWGDDKGKFLCYRKINNRIDPASTKNIAYQKDLYKIETEIESSFVTPFIDSRFASVVKKAQETPFDSLTRKEKFEIIRFIMLSHLRNPNEIDKIKSYQNDDNILKEIKQIVGREEFEKDESGFLNDMIAFVGLAMKEIGFSVDDLDKIGKNKRLFEFIYGAGINSLMSWSDELIEKYNDRKLYFESFDFDEPFLFTSNLPVYFGKPGGYLIVVFSISPYRCYVLSERIKFINDLKEKSCNDMIDFFNGLHINRKGILETYVHISQEQKLQECQKNA